MYFLGSGPSNRVLLLWLYSGGRGKQIDPVGRDRIDQLGFLLFLNGLLAEKDVNSLVSHLLMESGK